MEIQLGGRSSCDVLLEGGYFSDLIFTGLSEFPRLGHEIYSKDFHLLPGGAFNSAIALCRLGLKTAWPCCFGSDPFSQFVKQHAVEEGIDPAFFTDLDEPSLHITVAFSFNEERAFLSYSDEYADIQFLELLMNLRPAWLMISHLAFSEAYTELFSVARKQDTLIYMDCQAHNNSIDDPQVEHALRQVDVFSPNLEEARRLTGCESAEEALEKLAQIVPLVIIKLGKDGCVCRQGEQTLRIPGLKVQVLDTTGAGDNFDSGFICGQIRGFTLEDSLRMANICGALSTQGYGGTSTSPTFNQVKRFLEDG